MGRSLLQRVQCRGVERESRLLLGDIVPAPSSAQERIRVNRSIGLRGDARNGTRGDFDPVHPCIGKRLCQFSKEMPSHSPYTAEKANRTSQPRFDPLHPEFIRQDEEGSTEFQEFEEDVGLSRTAVKRKHVRTVVMTF